MKSVVLKLGKHNLNLSLDMYTLTVFNRAHGISLSGFDKMFDHFLLMFELFYEGVQRGESLKGREVQLTQDQFGSLLAEHPEELKKCLDKFVKVTQGMVATVQTANKSKKEKKQ